MFSSQVICLTKKNYFHLSLNSGECFAFNILSVDISVAARNYKNWPINNELKRNLQDILLAHQEIVKNSGEISNNSNVITDKSLCISKKSRTIPDNLNNIHDVCQTINDCCSDIVNGCNKITESYRIINKNHQSIMVNYHSIIEYESSWTIKSWQITHMLTSFVSNTLIYVLIFFFIWFLLQNKRENSLMMRAIVHWHINF